MGDAAYTLSDILLIIPFTGTQHNDVDNDAYNFYLSQLQICIEMAFGHLVQKWGILQKIWHTSYQQPHLYYKHVLDYIILSLNSSCYIRHRIQ